MYLVGPSAKLYKNKSAEFLGGVYWVDVRLVRSSQSTDVRARTSFSLYIKLSTIVMCNVCNGWYGQCTVVIFIHGVLEKPVTCMLYLGT